MAPKIAKSSEQDKRTLIEEVDKYEFLYNRKHKDYMNRALKVKTWAAIGKHLNVSGKNYLGLHILLCTCVHTYVIYY